jgi:hypothetical protein
LNNKPKEEKIEFDIITAWEVVEHIHPDDLSDFFKYINENVAPYISASTDYILKDICVSWLLLGQKGDSYKIKIKKPNAKVIDLTLVHEETKEEAIYPNYDFEKKLYRLDYRQQGKRIMEVHDYNTGF